MKHLKTLLAAAAVTLSFSAAAEAYPYPYRHWHGGSNVVFYSGPAYPYYRPVYVAQPVYAYPPPPPVYIPSPDQGPMYDTAAPAPQQQADGRYCREYQRDIRVGSRIAPAYGTACMQPDGSWQIVSE